MLDQVGQPSASARTLTIMFIHSPQVKLTIPHAMDAMFREVKCGAHGLSAATSAKIFDTLLTCLVCLTLMMLLLFHT